MIKINFNDLLNNYNKNLLDNLRGFGSDKEYLKFYVPGTTTIRSFHNLIDALIESKCFEFIIVYKESSLEKEFFDEAINFLKQISVFDHQINAGNLNIRIKLNLDLYKIFQQNTRKNKQDTKKKLPNKIHFKSQIKTFESKEKINQIYLDNIFKIKTNEYFSEESFENKNLFSNNIEGHQLNFVIENKNIVKLYHNCKNDRTIRQLLNIFFDICINKNIQEAAEHAAIYLEEKIRIIDNRLIKPGIILPTHAGTYFDQLNYIIRDVFRKYASKNNLELGINKNYYKKTYHWVNLPEEIKIKKIEIILKEVLLKYELSDQSIIVQSIDNNFKVNLGATQDFKNLQLKKNMLLEIEIRLKDLDNTLEVFMDEVLDKNKLRLKNSPQTKLLN